MARRELKSLSGGPGGDWVVRTVMAAVISESQAHMLGVHAHAESPISQQGHVLADSPVLKILLHKVA
jgi:hypothetical protein